MEPTIYKGGLSRPKVSLVRTWGGGHRVPDGGESTVANLARRT